jgi:hypothetical protein
MLRILFILTGLTALSSPTVGGAPIEIHRNELPPTIAGLHTCIGPRDRTLSDAGPRHVGKRWIFRVGCPRNGPATARLPHRYDSGDVRKPDEDPDQFESSVYYLADDARGRNAKRLALPYPRADGTTVIAEAFDAPLDFGWSVRANTSVASGVAYLDLNGTAIGPRGEFMVAIWLVPADRPEIKDAFAMWRVKGDNAELIYWAETRETRPKDAPWHKSPPYTIVLDKRPEK